MTDTDYAPAPHMEDPIGRAFAVWLADAARDDPRGDPPGISGYGDAALHYTAGWRAGRTFGRSESTLAAAEGHDIDPAHGPGCQRCAGLPGDGPCEGVPS